MEHEDTRRTTEAQEVADVQARLTRRFPDAGRDVVAAAVRTAHSEMTGPVRDYVPVLVEHAVRKRLAKLGHRPGPSAAAVHLPR